MTENLRQHPRKEIRVEVEISFMDDQPRACITRDVSQGGLFIFLEDPSFYPLGEMVSLEFSDPLNKLTPTHKEAIVVRRDDTGIGVAFVEIGDEEPIHELNS